MHIWSDIRIASSSISSWPASKGYAQLRDKAERDKVERDKVERDKVERDKVERDKVERDIVEDGA